MIKSIHQVQTHANIDDFTWLVSFFIILSFSRFDILMIKYFLDNHNCKSSQYIFFQILRERIRNICIHF